MRDELRLRRRIPEDLPAAIDVLRSTHVTDGFPSCWPHDPAAWLAPDDEREAWVAEADGTVIGHVALHRASRAPVLPLWSEATGLRADQMGVVSRLIVLPSIRRQGVGSALFGAVVERIHASGQRAVLYTGAPDRAAIAWYDRLGWRRVGEVSERLPNGTDIRLLAFVEDA